jgi:transcriptional regulator with XRE-family HTH domain
VGLSERSGVPQSTISSIERNGGNPKVETLVALADALGCTIEQLTGEVTRWPLSQEMRDELCSLVEALQPDSQHTLLALARQLLLLQRAPESR